MKNLQNIVLMMCVCIIYYACNDSKKNADYKEIELSDSFIEFNLKKDAYDNTIFIENFIDSIEYIPLETNHNCMISNIFQIHSDTGYYFIHDQLNNNLFQFDLNGRFIRKIGVKGKGPEEYLDVYDVALDKINKIVSLMDLSGRKYLKFNYSGDFIESVIMDILCEQHEFSSLGVIYNITRCHNPKYQELNNYCLAQTNNNSKVNYFIKNNNNHSFETLLPLRKFGDRIFFNIPYKSSIIEINGSSIEKIFSFDFSEVNKNNQINLNELNNEELHEYAQNNAFFNGEFVLSDSILFFGYPDRHKICDYYYSIKTDSLIYGSSYSIRDGRNVHNDFKLAFFRRPRWMRYDQKFVSMVDPISIIDGMKLFKMDKLSQYEREILKNISAKNNPILVVYNLQEF